MELGQFAALYVFANVVIFWLAGITRGHYGYAILGAMLAIVGSVYFFNTKRTMRRKMIRELYPEDSVLAEQRIRDCERAPISLKEWCEVVGITIGVPAVICFYIYFDR